VFGTLGSNPVTASTAPECRSTRGPPSPPPGQPEPQDRQPQALLIADQVLPSAQKPR
jgi:hypothetical protein